MLWQILVLASEIQYFEHRLKCAFIMFWATSFHPLPRSVFLITSLLFLFSPQYSSKFVAFLFSFFFLWKIAKFFRRQISIIHPFQISGLFPPSHCFFCFPFPSLSVNLSVIFPFIHTVNHSVPLLVIRGNILGFDC